VWTHPLTLRWGEIGTPGLFSERNTCMSITVFRSINQRPELDRGSWAAFVQGFVDGYLWHRYDDGVSPPHHMTVFCPLFGNSEVNAYREGWLAGMKARLCAN
jgi:hypothetical protein